MEVLGRARFAVALAGLALTACYDPVLDDCTVTCKSEGDCGGGQVCGSDGYCAYAEVAGTCREGGGGGSGSGIGPGGETRMLRITIEHKGRVTVAMPRFTCETGDDRDRADCSVAVPVGAAIDLEAVVTNKPFDRWTTANCPSSSTGCRLMVAADITVGARFE